MWLRIIRVQLNERAVVLQNGLPRSPLAPGRHFVWGANVTALRWNTDELVFDAAPEVRAVLPREWYSEVTLGARERGVLSRDGRPLRFLRPGRRRFWTVDPSVELRVLDVDQPLPELTDELLSVLPRPELELGVVGEHERGLKYVQGRLTEVLGPGRYAFWSYPEARVNVAKVDIRRDQVALVGQELMTRDKVSLRLSFTIEYAVVDPARAAHGVTSLRDALYLLVQLAAREFVGAVTLDELLEGRDAMARHLLGETAPRAEMFGVRVERVGVKDVVLPGEMKVLLNRVIEAEKEAAANVILRREETAATRSLANTARVMAEHPVLLRLKELETMKQIAEQIDEVRLVVGADGLQSLLPAELLGRQGARP